MRFKTTVLLSFILTLLGFYLYFVEFPTEKKQQEAKQVEGKLFSFSTDEITRVIIRGPKGEIDMEYFPGHPETPWRIFNPVETVANKHVGSELGELLEGIKASRLVEEKPTELVNFGLDPPLFTVIITLQNNNTEIIEVGAENLTGTDVYVKKGMGTSLYLVPAGVKKILNKDLREWRLREVFPYSSFDISMMRLISPKGKLELSKTGDGWSMAVETIKSGVNKERTFRGDAGEIANLLGTIVNLQGKSFIDVNKVEKKRKFAPPILKITVKVGHVERTGSFYKDDAVSGLINVVTMPLDPIFQLFENELSTIEQPLETYRDKRVISLSFPEEIETLEINRPKQKFVLNKKEGRWLLEAEHIEAVEEMNKVSRLLTDLYNLRVESFLDDLDVSSPEVGFENPLLTLHLKGKGGKSLGNITMGAIEGDLIYAKSTGQPFPFSLKKEVFDRIPQKEDLLQQK